MKQVFPERVRERLLVVAAAGVVFFLNLGEIALWDEDEPKNAVCAREMFERGDWLVPTFNGQLRTDKPILLYWLMLGAYHAFGVCEFSARFWSACFGVATVLLTADLGRRLGPSGSGLWSGLVLSGSLLFAVSARAATPDATLIVATTFALWAYISGSAAGRLSWPGWWGVFIGLGLATLAKGPSGFLLPGIVIVLSETLRRRQSIPTLETWGQKYVAHSRELLRAGREAIRSLRLIRGMGVTAIVACPWYLAVGYATNWAWPMGFLGRHNVQRFLGPLEGHGGPVVYYIPGILIGLAPWSLWLWPALRSAWQRGNGRQGDWSDAFLWAWIGVYVVVFSLAGTKLPSYVLPCYPALAILIGKHLGLMTQVKAASDNERPLVQDNLALPRTEAGPFLILALLGAGLTAALLVAAEWIGPHVRPAALLGIVPLAGGLLGWRWHLRDQPRRALGAFAMASVLLLAGLFGLAADLVDGDQTPVAFARQIRTLHGQPARVATLDAFRPTLVYYSGSTVADCPTPAEAATFLHSFPDGFLVTRADQWPSLAPLLPEGARVLIRRRMFLRDFDLLLIGREGPALARNASIETQTR